MKYISISFSSCCFIFLLILIYAFFSKNRVKSKETNVYSFLIFVNCALLVSDIVGFCFYNIPSLSNDIKIFISKTYLTIYALFGTVLLYYTNYIMINNAKRIKTLNFGLITCYVVTFLLIFILPLEIVYHDDFARPVGMSLNVGYTYSFLLVLYFIIVLLCTRKKLDKTKIKKMSPMILLIGLGTLAVIIQNINSDVVLLLTVDTISTFIMYFTIENPDVKMLAEFKIAKDRAEKANEEKEIFLYDITQDIRMPLYDIRKASSWLDTNAEVMTKNSIHDGMKYINSKTTNILDKVNNVLDISNMELTNIKVYETKYDILNIVEHIKRTYKIINKDNVKMDYLIDTNIPKYLYGDSLRLKQLISILIDNAIKYTDKGTIFFKLNSINKNDISRLIITVEDTGSGIKASEIDEIFNKENKLYNSLDKIDDSKKNLAIAKSIATLLGGVLLLESEIGKGTKLTLVLDQLIYKENSKELDKLESDTTKYVAKKKVMLVIENDEYMVKVLKKLSKYDIDVEAIDKGAKCLDKIRLKNKYDLIMIDEELKYLSSLEVLRKLKKITNFKTPVCLLTDNIENDNFVSEGFTYLIDKKLDKKSLDSLLEID